METGQRRTARRGLPRFAVAVGAGRRDRVAAGAPPHPRPMPEPALAAGAVADRYDAAGHAARCAGRDRDSACAAHWRRAAVQQPDGAVSLSRLRAAGRRAPEVSGVGATAAGGVSGVVVVTPPSGGARPLHRLEPASAATEPSSACLQHAVSHPAVGESAAPGISYFGVHGGSHLPRLGSVVCASDLSAGDVRRPGTIPRNLLSGGELESTGGDDGTWQGRSHAPAEPFYQAGAGAALAPAFSGAVERMKRPRIDVNLGELDQLLDQAQQAPLSEPDCHKIKTTLHTLVEMLVAKRTTEKTRTVVDPAASETAAAEPASSATKANRPARTPASAYAGARSAVGPDPGPQ